MTTSTPPSDRTVGDAVTAATTPFMQSPQFMWLLLACIALASPILILLLRGVIQKEASPDV